jgi:hypothetical protein
MAVSVSDRKRLIAILGMLGSDQPGERDNAARLAEKFRRDHNLTWTALLALEPSPEQQSNPSAQPPPPSPKPEPTPPSPPSHSQSKRVWRMSEHLDDLSVNLGFVIAMFVPFVLVAIFSARTVIGLGLVCSSTFAVRRLAGRRSKWELMGWLGLPLGSALLLYDLF